MTDHDVYIIKTSAARAGSARVHGGSLREGGKRRGRGKVESAAAAAAATAAGGQQTDACSNPRLLACPILSADNERRKLHGKAHAINRPGGREDVAALPQ